MFGSAWIIVGILGYKNVNMMKKQTDLIKICFITESAMFNSSHPSYLLLVKIKQALALTYDPVFNQLNLQLAKKSTQVCS